MSFREPHLARVGALMCILTLIVTTATSAVNADSVVIGPDRDNTIFTDGTDAPADFSNGAGPHIFAGRTLFNGLRRGLIRFDIAGNVPAGAVIESAELTMHVSLGTNSTSVYMLHRVESDWGEGASNSGTGSMNTGTGGGMGAPAEPGDATWMHAFFDTQPWTNLGGDFNAMPSGSAMIGVSGADYTWASTPEMVADVQAWLDSPSANFGWLIKNDEPPALQGRAKRFDSRENETIEFRPRLTIEYSAPPPLEEAVIPATKDNTIFADEFGPQDLSNGAGPHLFSGKTTFSGPRRALLAFDIASSVPAGATVVDAELTLHMSLGTQGSYDFALHRILADWGEGASNSGSGDLGSGAGGGMGAPAEPGDVTWTDRFFPGMPWMQLGGDFDAAESAVATVGGAVDFYTWGSTPGMVADVQGWVDNPSANFGWILVGIIPPDATRTAKRFDSRENPDPAARPQLIVHYTMSQPQCGTCPGDIDGSGGVNGADIQGFVHCLLTGSTTEPGCPCADMDGDGAVTVADTSEFVAAVVQAIDCEGP